MKTLSLIRDIDGNWRGLAARDVVVIQELTGLDAAGQALNTEDAFWLKRLGWTVNFQEA